MTGPTETQSRYNHETHEPHEIDFVLFVFSWFDSLRLWGSA
jgi:hypothetical protein